MAFAICISNKVCEKYLNSFYKAIRSDNSIAKLQEMQLWTSQENVTKWPKIIRKGLDLLGHQEKAN